MSIIIESNYRCIYSVTPTQDSFIVLWHNHPSTIYLRVCSHQLLLPNHQQWACEWWLVLVLEVKIHKKEHEVNTHLTTGSTSRISKSWRGLSRTAIKSQAGVSVIPYNIPHQDDNHNNTVRWQIRLICWMTQSNCNKMTEVQFKC